MKQIAACIERHERWCTGPSASAAERAEFWALKGQYAHANRDLEQAETLMLKAYSNYLEAGSPWKLGNKILRVLGYCAYEKGDYHRGLVYYRENLAIHLREEPDKAGNVAGAHYNVGNCFWGLDQRDSCSIHYNEALRIWRSVEGGGPPMVAYVHEVLGTHAWEAGDQRGALEHFNLAAARQLKDAPATDAADTMADSAAVAATGGHPDEALRLYQQALEFRERTLGPDHPSTACMSSELARMLATMDRPEEAMGRAQEAISRLVPGFIPADDLSNPSDVKAATNHRHLLDALVVKYRLLRARPVDARASRAADECIDLSVQCIEHLRTGALAEGSKLFWTTQVRDFIEEALEHCRTRFTRDGDEASIERAITLMELSRNALLAEAMRALEALSDAGLPRELIDEERTLKARIAEMRRYILLEEKKCDRMDVDKVGLWRNAAAAGQAELDGLIQRMAVEHPAYHELKYAPSTFERKALQARLGSDRSLLCMFLGSKHAYLILLDASGAQFVRNDDVLGMQQAAKGLRDLLADRARSLTDPQGAYAVFTEHARTLHQLLFGGITVPPRTALVIVPDGPFHQLPWEVLLTDAPRSATRDYSALPYLLRSHAISYVASIRNWMRSASPSTSTGEYLGVAASYPASTGLVELRSNADEVEAVRELLGGELLIGDAATESAFKRMAAEASILHLAMHTAMDDIDPMNSVFAFARVDSLEDGRLHLHEIFNLDLHVRLAVLSACRTGDGRAVNGEGVMSAARAFAHAGCPSMVMSLWNCEDEAARSIIASFFGHAAQGMALDQALQSAKLDYLEQSDPQKAHPYYWSTMVLMGDERVMGLSKPWYKRNWIWIVLGGILVLLLVRKRFQ
ncbi:MAG: CHAT domain-containing protein [Flavobacteriales bacterium]|nr:CHAT domain-containing protein [Flavobacteriales bacterium]